MAKKEVILITKNARSDDYDTFTKVAYKLLIKNSYNILTRAIKGSFV